MACRRPIREWGDGRSLRCPPGFVLGGLFLCVGEAGYHVAHFAKLLAKSGITYPLRGVVGVENGMDTMEIHVLERALTAACIVAVIAVIWWGFKILAA